jgi:hypothetical protein
MDPTTAIAASDRTHECLGDGVGTVRAEAVTLCPASGTARSAKRWEIEDEPGEVAISLEGDVGLVPLPEQ